jgi:TonB family protein
MSFVKAACLIILVFVVIMPACSQQEKAKAKASPKSADSSVVEVPKVPNKIHVEPTIVAPPNVPITHPPGSDLQILSDTEGVNFEPYLRRVAWQVKNHWYNLIPDAARAPIMKSGSVTIQFAIAKTGEIQGMTFLKSSGVPTLDFAAWRGIKESGPFVPLPADFKGSSLQLQMTFWYNPKEEPPKDKAATTPPAK